jgi:hypothetical protein
MYDKTSSSRTVGEAFDVSKDQIQKIVKRKAEVLDYEKLPGIDNHVQTCQSSADWDLPARELLAECAQPCTASDSDNSDSEATESQAPPSLDRAQECIQELRTFALHTGNTTFLDHVMDLQDLSVTIRMNSSLKQSKINDFFI